MVAWFGIAHGGVGCLFMGVPAVLVCVVALFMVVGHLMGVLSAGRVVQHYGFGVMGRLKGGQAGWNFCAFLYDAFLLGCRVQQYVQLWLM